LREGSIELLIGGGKLQSHCFRRFKVSTATTTRKKAGGLRAGNVTATTEAASLQDMFDRQVCEALWIPSDLSREEILERMTTAVAAVRSLKPQGIIEKMLAVQIVAAHNAALDCFRRAALPGQSPPVWEMSLRQSDRLMDRCRRHIESFVRLRGKDAAGLMLGNFLNVEPGGQAVVQMQSEVSAKRSNAPTDPPTLPLEHQPIEALDLRQSSTPVASDERIRRSPRPVPQDERIRRLPVPSDERIRRGV
jgi:hypothetical protein